MPRRKLVAGNWKMNTTLAEAKALAAAVAGGVGAGTPAVGVAVCPPFPWLLPVGESHQREVHRQTQVVPAAHRDVAVREQLLAPGPLGPLHHRQRGANGPVPVEHLESQAIGPEASLGPGERGGSLATQERPVGLVSGQRAAGEVAGPGVPGLDGDRGIGETHVNQQAFGHFGRSGRPGTGVGYGLSWASAGEEGQERAAQDHPGHPAPARTAQAISWHVS